MKNINVKIDDKTYIKMINIKFEKKLKNIGEVIDYILRTNVKQMKGGLKK